MLRRKIRLCSGVAAAVMLTAFIAGCVLIQVVGEAPPLLPEPVTSPRSQEVISLLYRGPVVARVTDSGVTIMGRPVNALLGEAVTVVVAPESNIAPQITSTPPLSGTMNVALNYHATATDPNSEDTVPFSLEEGPGSATINSVSGQLT